MADTNKKSGQWMDQVRLFAAQAYKAQPLEGAIILEVLCVYARPKTHYGTGKNASKLRPGAPRHKTTMPDCSKLLRGIEDGMTGVIYKDDRQIVSTKCVKIWGDRDYAEIFIETAEEL